jgi:3-hydroxyisobutyrate dehydrogenase
VAKSKNYVFVDAPVSGGVNGAKQGTLTFMVGSRDKTDFERSKQLLQTMGKNIVHCGGPGTGEVAKICNNLVLAISMIGVSEAMNLGVKLGMDRNVLAGIMNSSTARCWSSDSYNPAPGVAPPTVPSSNDYEGGFGSSLMLKDLGLAGDAARDAGTPIPLGNAAQSLYQTMVVNGLGKKDFSVVYRFLGGK